MKRYAVLAILLFFSGTALADEVPIVSVAEGGACIDGVNGYICHHVTEGHDITLRVDQPEGAACKELKVMATQTSTRLEMPLPDDAVRQTGKDCQHQEFIFTAPLVKRETEFYLRVLYRNQGAWTKIQDVNLKAYPATLLDGVRSWADNDKNALVVKDKEGEFTAFLDRNKIRYYGSANTPRDVAVAVIVVGEPEENEKPENNTLFLEEKSFGIAKVKILEKENIITVRTQLKLMASLKADDPLAQKEFAELFAIIAK
ncbi:MAG: hypothetical protein ACAH80_14665 [Alphaproteobacteria bacterium]